MNHHHTTRPQPERLQFTSELRACKQHAPHGNRSQRHRPTPLLAIPAPFTVSCTGPSRAFPVKLGRSALFRAALPPGARPRTAPAAGIAREDRGRFAGASKVFVPPPSRLPEAEPPPDIP